MPVLKNLLGKSPTDPTRRLRNYLANEVLGTKQSTLHENVINPGGTIPWHVHSVEEIIVVLEGFGECRTEQGTETFTGGDVIILPEGQHHSLRNIGGIALRQLCFFPGPPGTQWLGEEAEPGHRGETRDGLP